MLKDIDCPCCTGCTKSVINCQCGYEEDKFKGDAVLHRDKYCNKKYTQCGIYQGLRNKLQNLEEEEKL